jgi:hypothetical protein
MLLPAGIAGQPNGRCPPHPLSTMPSSTRMSSIRAGMVVFSFSYGLLNPWLVPNCWGRSYFTFIRGHCATSVTQNRPDLGRVRRKIGLLIRQGLHSSKPGHFWVGLQGHDVRFPRSRPSGFQYKDFGLGQVVGREESLFDDTARILNKSPDRPEPVGFSEE